MTLTSTQTSRGGTLLTRLQNHLQDSGLVAGEHQLALAVSGGLDSVVMLHLFHRLREILKLDLAAFHVEHGLRAASVADLEFVRNLAATCKCPFYFRQVDVKAYVRRNSVSAEEAARALRYEAFEQMSRECGNPIVATAHTMNDQAETVLDRLMRGAGVLGMSGMRRQRGRYVRPLLIFLRGELESYALENKLEYREDETNRSLVYKRNRIRHVLIPLLEEFNPAVVSTLTRTSDVFSEVEDFLTAYTDDVFPSLVTLQKKNQIVLEIDRFLGYFKAIQKYVLFKALEQFSLNRSALHYDLLQSILSAINRRQVGKRFELDGGLELMIDHDGIVLQRHEHLRNEKLAVIITDSDGCEFGSRTFKWKILEPSDRPAFKNDRTIELFDFHKVGGNLLLRTFRPGDRFVPLNLGGTKKVADFFSDKKVPLRQRQDTPILESERGIVWICGHGIDDRFKVTDETQKVLKMEVRTGRHVT